MAKDEKEVPRTYGDLELPVHVDHLERGLHVRGGDLLGLHAGDHEHLKKQRLERISSR